MAIKSNEEPKRSIIMESITAADARDNRLSGALKETVRKIIDFRRKKNYAPDKKNPSVRDVRLFWDFIDCKFVANKHSYGRTMWIANVNFNRMNGVKWKKATSELNLDEAVAAATETVARSILKRSRELVSLHETADSTSGYYWSRMGEIKGYLHPDRVALQRGLLRGLACKYLNKYVNDGGLAEFNSLHSEYIGDRHFQNEVELVKSELREEVLENHYLAYDEYDMVFPWIENEFGIDVVLDCLLKGQHDKKWNKADILDYILDKLDGGSIRVTEQMLNWSDEHIKDALAGYSNGVNRSRFFKLATIAPKMLRSQYINHLVANSNWRSEMRDLRKETESGKTVLPLPAIISDINVYDDARLVTRITAKKMREYAGYYTDVVITDFEYDTAVVDAKYNGTPHDIKELQYIRSQAFIVHASHELVQEMRGNLLVPKKLVELMSASKAE